FFFSSRRRHTRFKCDWSSDVCSSDLHTVGTHTWSHAALTNKKLTEDQRKEEIELGISAVKWALGGNSPAPFFRFPALQHPPEMRSEERRVGRERISMR